MACISFPRERKDILNEYLYRLEEELLSSPEDYWNLCKIVTRNCSDNSYSDHKAEEYKKLTFTDAYSARWNLGRI